ncbi:class I SAM-dependent methyltransferase [Sinomonas sp. G460-2]|uniref:class I SAM-dependent methyltransferase n=1 Tax=Sinomonas sp. G460-2 TaxID=3393464 RepID=UPI0039EE508F
MTRIGRRILEAGFGHPSGTLGRIGGHLMARGNADTERHLVDLAGLTEGERVVVLGPGPGVGLYAAGMRCANVIGIDPSELMREAAARRCAELVRRGRVSLEAGQAQDTGQPTASADAVLTVNTVHIWPNLTAGFTEICRVLRPGGRLLLSAHQKWLPGGAPALAKALASTGFTDIETWTWNPPGRGAGTAVQLRAARSAH